MVVLLLLGEVVMDGAREGGQGGLYIEDEAAGSSQKGEQSIQHTAC
jgi:hypothetical protein